MTSKLSKIDNFSAKFGEKIDDLMDWKLEQEQRESFESTQDQCNSQSKLELHVEQKEKVKEEKEEAIQDFSNLSNFADISSTKINYHRTTPTSDESKLEVKFLGFPLFKTSNSPSVALMNSPNANSIGDCWSMDTRSMSFDQPGRFSFDIRRKIRPSHFSLKRLSESSSGPKNVSLFAFADQSSKSERIELINVDLDVKKTSSNTPSTVLKQTFQFPPETLQKISNLALNLFELDIYENFGHEKYTCLYQVEVHGILSREV